MIQRMLLVMMLALPVIGVQAQVAQEDSLALVALYEATDGANWSVNGNWLSGPVPTWSGVQVTSGRVTALRLLTIGLTGEIPAELGNLTNLKQLRLFASGLTGEIPVELGNLTNLIQLILGGNMLTGEILAELGNLTNLFFLDVSNNMLNGTLPLTLTNLSRLIFFFFENTNLCESVDETFQTWIQGIPVLASTGCTNVANEARDEIPRDFALGANYPNPFNASMVLAWPSACAPRRL